MSSSAIMSSSGRDGGKTILTSVRIRPRSEAEAQQFPGPCPVVAGDGEVRLHFVKGIATSGGSGGSGRSR